MAVQIARRLRLFTIDEYERMIEAGVFGEDERIELIEGEIIRMAPIGIHHEACVARIELLLHELVRREAIVWVQQSIRLAKSQPQPDLALLKWDDDFYVPNRPTAGDVILLIEVADTSLSEDRRVKVPLYAGAGIPEMWVVNLPEQVVEVYSDPGDGAYRDIKQARRGDSLPLPAGLEGVVRVDDILG